MSEDWSVRVTPPEVGVRVVEGDLEVRWPAGLPDFQLQVAESLSAGAAWVDVRIAPTEANGQDGIRLNPAQNERFFRLVRR